MTLASLPQAGSEVFHLEFDQRHSYQSTAADTISVPVVLRSGSSAAWLTAKIDTGASHCLFERGHGEIIGLDIEAGDRKVFSTVAGQVEAFGHIVQLHALDIVVESMVYFFANGAITKTVLGRTGWLDRVRLGIVDYDRTLYLAHYDFDPIK